MVPNQIIGRKVELEILEQLYQSKAPEFLAVYGRRRIGKTYLLNGFFKDKGTYFEITGVKDAKIDAQLHNFRVSFADTFFNGVLQTMPNNWQEAFDMLCKQIQNIPTNQKVILFLDELPWLASRRSRILSALEYLWNRYLSRMPNVILVVCGSSASWIMQKIIYNTGGLYGRLTREMHLKPFTLLETEEFLKAKKIELDRKQTIELYMALGGVAKYLSYVDRAKSATQIINDLCFNQGPLVLEFPKLFESLFENPENYIAIITVLATKKSGMTQEELQKKTKLPSGGSFTRLLYDLQNTGFVLACPKFLQKKKETRYRLIDEYSLFYLQWIKPALNSQLHNPIINYWTTMRNSALGNTWAGFAFESICFKHINNIVEGLKLSIVARSYTTWAYVSNDKEVEGAQIDLIIDRQDNCINLCEIKFANAPFIVDKQYAEKLNYKKICFMTQTKTTKSLFTTLITPNGAKENLQYYAAVDNQITMDVLFLQL